MTTLEYSRQQIKQAREQVQEIYAALQRQQELLRLRNVIFQPGLLSVMDALSAGLERVERAMRDDETELTQFRVVAQTSALINSSLDLDTVLASAMDAVLRLTSAERGYILLLNDSGELELRVARMRESAEMTDGDDSVSRTILREVIETGKPLLTDNAAHDPRVSKSDTVSRYTLRSIMCVPLVFKENIEGAIYVDNRYRENVFSERELDLLTAFANQTVIAIENARLYASVQTTLRDIMEATTLMENVFASIESGVITTDPRDAITVYNTAAANILNIPLETAFAQPVRAVLPSLSPDFEDALAAAQTQNTSSTLQTEPEIPGRGRIALNLKISPLKNADGETEGVAMVLDDLTEQREHDQMLDLLRRYLPPGMVESIHEIARLGIGGERREITCMFIDLGPLSQFAGQRPQQVMETLNVYLEAITNHVHQAGGLIDKYMGSEVMALFNTQLNPQQDHALRAIETALGLQDLFGTLYRQQGLAYAQPPYRIGIHTGIATLGNVGSIQRRSFTALGDSINLAKRLQENALGGQIVVSEDSLAGLVASSLGFAVVERATIQARGRRQSTRIYEVVRT